jgi:hypothetical protein
MRKLFTLFFSLFMGIAYAAPNLTAEINMDVRADTAAAARREATDSATRGGVIQVLARYSDRVMVENLIMSADEATLNRLVAAVSISNERSSRTAYSATFSITLDRGAMDRWYSDNNVPNFLAAADGPRDKSLIVIQLNNGLDDWRMLNQMMRESGQDFGLTVRSIFRNSATAHIYTRHQRAFRQLCANNGWIVSTQEGVMRIARHRPQPAAELINSY